MSRDQTDADAHEHRGSRGVKAVRGAAALLVAGSAAYSALVSEAPFLTEASFRFGLGSLALMFAAPPVLLADPIARVLLSRSGPVWRRRADVVVPILQGAVAAWAASTAYNLPHVYYVQTVGWGSALWTHALAMILVLLAWWLQGRRARHRGVATRTAGL